MSNCINNLYRKCSDGLKPIAFASRPLDDTEKKYSTGDKETL